MAWKNGYYYRNKRVGKRVVTEYVGASFAALLAEQMTERAKAEAEAKRQEWQAIRDEQQRLDQMVTDANKAVEAYTAALLLVTGHHQHKRQWRRKRVKST